MCLLLEKRLEGWSLVGQLRIEKEVEVVVSVGIAGIVDFELGLGPGLELGLDRFDLGHCLGQWYYCCCYYCC